MRTKIDIVHETLAAMEQIEELAFTQGLANSTGDGLVEGDREITQKKKVVINLLAELINDDKDQVVDEKLIGKRLNEVGAILRYFGADYRIVSVDGRGGIVTMDLRMWRRNLTVVEDIVTSITYG